MLCDIPNNSVWASSLATVCDMLLCQMQSLFFSSTADAPPGVSVVSKDQNFHAKSDFGSLKR